MRLAYVLVGAMLVVAGVAGFVQQSVFGIFPVTAVHNVIHVVSGATAIQAARRGIGPMRTWGKALALLYLLVAVLGFVLPGGSLAHDLFHLALVIFFLYYSLLAPPIH